MHHPPRRHPVAPEKRPSGLFSGATGVLTRAGSCRKLQIWPGGQDLSPWWFLAVVVFIIQTVAELFLSPVGLSTTSALAPKSFASQDDEVEPARRPRGIAECRHEQDALMGATGVFGGPQEIRECSRHLAVIASASSSKQLT